MRDEGEGIHDGGRGGPGWARPGRGLSVEQTIVRNALFCTQDYDQYLSLELKLLMGMQSGNNPDDRESV